MFQVQQSVGKGGETDTTALGNESQMGGWIFSKGGCKRGSNSRHPEFETRPVERKEKKKEYIVISEQRKKGDYSFKVGLRGGVL